MSSIELPEDLIDIAFKELGETPEIRGKCLEELRARILELPKEDQISDLSDINLIPYLRGRKFNVEKAVKTIVNYKQFCKAHPEWVENYEEEEMKCFVSFYNVLKEKTALGQRIVVLHFKTLLQIFTKEFAEKYPYARARSNIWLFEQLSRDVYVQVCGVIIVGYFGEFTFWDNICLSQLVPLEQHLGVFNFMNNCCGLRLSGVYMLHEPVFARFLFSLASIILSEKLRSRFHLCGSNYKPLFQAIPDKSILPQFLGGEMTEEDEYSWIAEQFHDSKKNVE